MNTSESDQAFTSRSTLLAQQARHSYGILLHALDHEENRKNIDRHVLVLDKWLRENAEGFYIRDLQYIIQIFPILRQRLTSDFSLFREILRSVVAVVSKPLLESRSSERLKPESIICIKEFYREYSLFFTVPDLTNSIELIKSFRCIVLGGVDPYILKADTVAWDSGDGLKTQVTDTEFLQTMIRDGLALDNIIGEFMRAMDAVGSGLDSFDPTAISLITNQQQQNDPATALEGGVEASMSSSLACSPSGELTQAMLQEWIIGVLDLVFDICANPVSAGYMCKAGACRGAIIFLNEYAAKNFRNPKVSKCVDIIWSCLEGFLEYADVLSEGVPGYDPLREEVLDFEFACFVLKDVLFKIMHQGYRLADKELRNE